MSKTREKVEQELLSLPEEMLDEVYEYMQFLQYKHKKDSSMQTAYASEKVLGKDWNTPEEEAWQNL